MFRNKVVYIPLVTGLSKNNEYLISMIRMLRKNYITEGNLASPVNFLQMLRTKAVFLNWTEYYLDLGMKIRLLLYKALGAKIVWVFHNKLPHDVEDSEKMRKNMLWLADNSSTIILHSKCSKRYVPNVKRNGKKAVFVPHILYKDIKNPLYVEKIRNSYGIRQDDFVFTVFGAVRPYKNIEGGIEAFKRLDREHTKLLIVGRADDRSYADKIRELCKDDESIRLDVQCNSVSNGKFGAVIAISDVIVMPYKNNSSMNSGVIIHAFSQGRTAIVPDICMARDMAREGFFYMCHNHDDIKNLMEKAYKNGKDANRVMGMKAKRYMMENNNEQLVYRALKKILK